MNKEIYSRDIAVQGQARFVLLLVLRIAVLFCLAVLSVHTFGRLLWPYEHEYYFQRRDSWVRRVTAEPEIIFIGSSTLLYGVSPSVVQRQLGLPEGSVINLGFEARSPSIAKQLWDQERSVLSKAKVVVYGLDPWILSEAYYNSDYLASLHFTLSQDYYHATHPEDFTHLNIAAWGGPAILHVIHGILSYSIRQAQPIPNPPYDNGGDILRGRPINYDTPARGYFEPYPICCISDLYLERLAELKHNIESTGATFLFLLPPKRTAWSASYRNGCADIDSELIAKLNRFLGPSRMFGSFDLVPLELQPTYFRDDFHLGETGQRWFSQWIAEHLPEALSKTPETIRFLSSY